MNKALRFLVFLLALMVIPLGAVAILLIPHRQLDVLSWVLVLVLWIWASLGYITLLGLNGFFHWAVHGPETRIIVHRPCRCAMAFRAKDGFYHLVIREDDFRLRLACTGERTKHRAFYVTGRKAKTVADVPLAERCPRPGCRRFEEEIHPACPTHGQHWSEPA